MVNWIPIVAASVAALPAAAAFFLSYGRYDGSFNDRVVFLYFIGGMAVGALLGFLTLLLFFSGISALLQVIILALLFPIATVAVINRRKWQGERHAIFNGGAAGLGAAVMLAFSFLYYRMQPPWQAAQAAASDAWVAAGKVGREPAVSSVPYAFDLFLIGQALLLAIGFAGLMFGLGLLAGDGVRRRKQFMVAFMGTAILIAPVIFLSEFMRDYVWTWVALVAAYGAIFGIAAERKLLIEGISEEDRKARRRRKRKAMMQQAGR